MNLKKALNKQAVCLHLKSETKDAVIEELVDLLDRSGVLKDRKAVLQAVRDRERKLSTGMQNGIAIPHGKADTVSSLVAAVGLRPEGIEFEAIDGQPSTIFVLTVSPATRTGPHIQFLAEISRLLNDASVRQSLLTAKSEEDVIRALTA